MSSDLYRDYSNEILKRPLPKLEPPPPTLFAMKNEKMVNIVEQQRPSSSSTIINVPQQPSSSSAAGNHRKQQWKANVNSAISVTQIEIFVKHDIRIENTIPHICSIISL
ncbi:hypothetical protein DERP_003484 [Dermatophagoides pteronyssinus]|uniref:Uncharacterized protein n=1 Tax=Dermatophagoides pteronyssinus TaxID=6956 RepID=A0ABQ8JLA8_DERPT|nr:hypothetical protein DERP_003484 [Dermatophagoides pteronyssinus]